MKQKKSKKEKNLHLEECLEKIDEIEEIGSNTKENTSSEHSKQTSPKNRTEKTNQFIIRPSKELTASPKLSPNSPTNSRTLSNYLAGQDEILIPNKRALKLSISSSNDFIKDASHSLKCHTELSPLHNFQIASANFLRNGHDRGSPRNKASSPINLPLLRSPVYNGNHEGKFSELARIVSPTNIESKEAHKMNMLSPKLKERGSFAYQLSNELRRKPEFNRGFISMDGNKLISFQQNNYQDKLRYSVLQNAKNVVDYNEKISINYGKNFYNNKERFFQPDPAFALHPIFGKRGSHLDPYQAEGIYGARYYSIPNFSYSPQNRLNL